jgi:hypothetical protein
VSATDHIIHSILVLLVLWQIRETRVSLRALLVPVVLVGAAAAYYLHPAPTAGNDVALYFTLASAGGVLGTLCALATFMHKGSDGVVLVRAGRLAAALWVAGIGAPMAFAYAASHGAGPTITRFSAAHHITGSSAWSAALALMALAVVTARLVILRLRATRLQAARAPAPAPTPASASLPTTQRR